MKITNGDVIRHCDDHELAQVILLKSVGMVVEVLQAMGEHERVAQFWNLIDSNLEPLVDEQAEWLSQEVNIHF